MFRYCLTSLSVNGPCASQGSCWWSCGPEDRSSSRPINCGPLLCQVSSARVLAFCRRLVRDGTKFFSSWWRSEENCFEDEDDEPEFFLCSTEALPGGSDTEDRSSSSSPLSSPSALPKAATSGGRESLSWSSSAARVRNFLSVTARLSAGSAALMMAVSRSQSDRSGSHSEQPEEDGAGGAS